jgi:hypothetical protein
MLTSPCLFLVLELHLKSQSRKDPSLEQETIISISLEIKQCQLLIYYFVVIENPVLSTDMEMHTQGNITGISWMRTKRFHTPRVPC